MLNAKTINGHVNSVGKFSYLIRAFLLFPLIKNIEEMCPITESTFHSPWWLVQALFSFPSSSSKEKQKKPVKHLILNKCQGGDQMCTKQLICYNHHSCVWTSVETLII